MVPKMSEVSGANKKPPQLTDRDSEVTMSCRKSWNKVTY